MCGTSLRVDNKYWSSSVGKAMLAKLIENFDSSQRIRRFSCREELHCHSAGRIR